MNIHFLVKGYCYSKGDDVIITTYDRAVGLGRSEASIGMSEGFKRYINLRTKEEIRDITKDNRNLNMYIDARFEYKHINELRRLSKGSKYIWMEGDNNSIGIFDTVKVVGEAANTILLLIDNIYINVNNVKKHIDISNVENKRNISNISVQFGLFDEELIPIIREYN